MDDSQLFLKVWKNALELVSARGYAYDEKYETINEEEIKHLISNNSLFIMGEKDNQKILIKLVTLSKIKSVNIKEIVSEIIEELQDSNSSFEIVLILKNKPTSIIKKLEKDKEYNNLQIMYTKQFMFNPTKHFLVPKHTKLPEKDIVDIINYYSLNSKGQLPVILRDDPIVRYYNFKPGDVIKIESSVGTMNTNYLYYRCVR